MAHRGLRVGKSAPDFELQSTVGRKMSLSEFTGKPVVLIFLRGTW